MVSLFNARLNDSKKDLSKAISVCTRWIDDYEDFKKQTSAESFSNNALIEWLPEMQGEKNDNKVLWDEF